MGQGRRIGSTQTSKISPFSYQNKQKKTQKMSLSAAASKLLLHAVNQGDVEQCQSLILEGRASLEYRNSLGETCLHVAAERGRVSVTELLLAYGADPNVTRHASYGGQSPLHIAVRHGHIAVVSALLSRLADANLLDAAGKSPLHDAVLREDATLVHLLLRSGASPSACDVMNKTPLNYAVERSHAAIVALLMPPRNGDDPEPSSKPLSFQQKMDLEDRRIVWRQTKGPA
jgi:ankyrin repeat protein